MAYDEYNLWRTQPIEQPTVSVVVPTYNESERLVPTLAAMACHVSELGEPWELIIADSGSTDGTAEIAEQLGFANMRILRSPVRDGKGAGVARGVLAAKGDYILFADADGSTPISVLGDFLDKMHSGEADVVIASRAHLADSANRSGLRRLLTAGLRRVVRAVLALGVDDSQCGFKLFRRSVAQKVFGHQTITGFSFDLEALYLARKSGARIVEVPVAWVDAPGSKVDPWREVVRFLRDIVTIRLNDMRGQYRHA